MYPFLLAICILLVSGVLAVLMGDRPRLSTTLGAGGAVIGCAIGLVSAVTCLFVGPPDMLALRWDMPLGSFVVGMDSLSAFFLIPIFLMPALSAVYGSLYMRKSESKKSPGMHWFFFNILVIGMAMVTVARDGLLFLVAWEVMSIAPFFLVAFEDEKENAHMAGWIYAVSAHIGAIPLLVLFILLSGQSGSMEFSQFHVAAGSAGVLFLLAVAGFATKAGFIPLHVWLPEFHYVAPTHVSSIMIKMGIYGLLRILISLGAPELWWGYVMIAIGLISGVLGVLFAISHHNLKRLLAYSSVDNIGVIALGIGLGLIGQATGSTVVMLLGYSGALLHFINQSIFKGLLFLSSGAVLHATGTLNIERLGGFHKKMPLVSLTFLVGAAAIAGLPPLNGFIGEFLIYMAGINAGSSLASYGGGIAGWCAFAGLALIGGLSAACFVRAYGAVFLGEPRERDLYDHAQEPGLMMLVPLLILAGVCVTIGLAGPYAFGVATPALSVLTGMDGQTIRSALNVKALGPLRFITAIFGLLIIFIVGLAYLRKRLLAGKTIGSSGTWDCGYAAPTARMQYTASSFAQPVTVLASNLLGLKPTGGTPSGTFPLSAKFETGVPGGAREYIYRPMFMGVANALGRFRWLQHGKIHLYVLYIAATLVGLLVWKL